MKYHRVQQLVRVCWSVVIDIVVALQLPALPGPPGERQTELQPALHRPHQQVRLVHSRTLHRLGQQKKAQATGPQVLDAVPGSQLSHMGGRSKV